MIKYYILKDNSHVEVSLKEWALWFDNFDNRLIEKTKTEFGDVSTVFLGMSTSFGSEPLLYETMVFGGVFD